MKTINLLLATFIIIMLGACKKEPMKDIDSGNWNHERSIVNIVFENQVGNSTITRDKEANGFVSFMFNDVGGNASQIKIKSIELSYGAKADVGVGSILNFNNPDKSASITVTSQTGETRDWKINYISFHDDLVGTWQITKLSLYGGFWPQWGGAAVFPNLIDRPWDWKSDGSGPVAEYDNTLIFSLEGIDASGNAYGKVNNKAGADGKYADFLFMDDPGAPIDVNYHYRMIPPGESSWKRDNAKGTVSFTDVNGKVTTGKFIPAGTEKLKGENADLTLDIANHAFRFDYVPTQIWIDIYKDREKVVENLINYWIQVKKIN